MDYTHTLSTEGLCSTSSLWTSAHLPPGLSETTVVLFAYLCFSLVYRAYSRGASLWQCGALIPPCVVIPKKVLNPEAGLGGQGGLSVLPVFYRWLRSSKLKSVKRSLAKPPFCSVWVRIVRKHLWRWRFAVLLWTAFPMHLLRLIISGFCPNGVSSPFFSCIHAGTRTPVVTVPYLCTRSQQSCPCQWLMLMNYRIQL